MIHRFELKTMIRRGCTGALLAALTLSLLSGCSGTGSMYTPEAYEDAALAGTGEPAAEGSTGSQTAEENPGHRRHRRRIPEGAMTADEASEEKPPVRQAWLEGTGSDLFTAQTVDSYYHFSLNGVSLKLPCSLSELAAAGWELAADDASQSGADLQVGAFSYEFLNAVPAGENRSAASAKNRGGDQQIRLCLGNVTDTPVPVSDCTVFGIEVSEESGADLKTAFGAGIGSSLIDLTSVFTGDNSVFTQTQYADGSCMIRYRFSNGLVEGERIPVLAEADEKDLAELMIARTGPDGASITDLSLYYFRLPQ